MAGYEEVEAQHSCHCTVCGSRKMKTGVDVSTSMPVCILLVNVLLANVFRKPFLLAVCVHTI